MASSKDALLTKYPGPHGYPAALDGIGSTAAPLLAGFAFALIGLTIDKSDALWSSDLSLLLLVCAGLLLVQAVQFTFIARRFYVSPADYLASRELAELDDFSKTELEQMQEGWLKSYGDWLPWVTRAYNLGTIVFLVAIASVLVPASGPWHMPALRVVAVLLALAGAFGEAAVATLGPRIERKNEIRHLRGEGREAS